MLAMTLFLAGCIADVTTKTPLQPETSVAGDEKLLGCWQQVEEKDTLALFSKYNEHMLKMTFFDKSATMVFYAQPSKIGTRQMLSFKSCKIEGERPEFADYGLISYEAGEDSLTLSFTNPEEWGSAIKAKTIQGRISKQTGEKADEVQLDESPEKLASFLAAGDLKKLFSREMKFKKVK